MQQRGRRRAGGGTVPLSRWLGSPNTVLREKAETILYHLGPDAGEALLQAAEEEARWLEQRRALLLLPLEVLSAVGLFFALRAFVNVELALLYGMIGFVSARGTWRLLETCAGRHARMRNIALALARRNDLRSIGPLIDVWRPAVLGRSVRDDEVEHELSRLLPKFMAQNRLTLRNDKMALLRAKLGRIAPRAFGPRARLSDERADLLVTLLQLLARTGGERNRAVLRRLSRVRATTANAQLVRDAAEVLLSVPPAAPAPSPPVPVMAAAPRASGTVAPPTTAAPLSLRRP